jgi:hypothetical protein
VAQGTSLRATNLFDEGIGSLLFLLVLDVAVSATGCSIGGAMPPALNKLSVTSSRAGGCWGLAPCRELHEVQ